MLLTVRARQLRNHAGQISFPGGRRDAEDADVDANALREAHEEVGLDPAHVTVVGYLDDYPTITGFRVTPVVGLIDARTPLAPDGVEVASFFEVPLAFLLDPANYQRHWFRRDGLDLPFYAVPYGERFIWGATAGMLYELAQRCAAVMD